MTLEQWDRDYGRGRVQYPGGNPHNHAVVHGIGPADPGWRNLYRLTDYHVSSVAGGSVWLSPR